MCVCKKAESALTTLFSSVRRRLNGGSAVAVADAATHEKVGNRNRSRAGHFGPNQLRLNN